MHYMCLNRIPPTKTPENPNPTENTLTEQWLQEQSTAIVDPPAEPASPGQAVTLASSCHHWNMDLLPAVCSGGVYTFIGYPAPGLARDTHVHYMKYTVHKGLS